MKTRELTEDERDFVDAVWQQYLGMECETMAQLTEAWEAYQSELDVAEIVPTLAGYRKQL